MTYGLAGADDWSTTAAESVRTLFGRRMLGLPGTYLPDVSWPGRRQWFGPWHYWWLAHFIDCLVDEAQRERAAGHDERADRAETIAHQLLRTLRWRNVFRFVNHYYDDMAWLLLAAHRLDRLDGGLPVSPTRRRVAQTAGRQLRTQVLSADTDDLGGGLYWNDHRDFKNVPATGPAAIFFARIGDTERARRLVDWLYANLHDPEQGLFLDGIRIGPDGATTTVRDIYTYNQGTVLGALVELGDPISLRRASELIGAVHDGLARPGSHLTLTTHGGHDGGLFTGITARYLAMAARSPGIDPTAREQAAALVHGTAEALWSGREEVTTAGGLDGLRRRLTGMPPATACVFSPDPAVPARESQPRGIPVELSTQLQAWMVLEAAATL
ncbi:MAG TPA: glycoside hydrolase family 76 protein [Dermatophilaceae bacterium]|nr:glycoside hydrolase family 76 protein [Dermatophilaceae bacterium]